jgi:REP element-mobilizing transposase RayT
MKTLLLEPGKCYHIYNRAKNGDPLFENEEAFRFFMRLYRTHVVPVADTFAYCLLKDHLHLLVRIKSDASGSVYKPFALLFNAYAKGYNNHNDRQGKLFQFKLKRIEIRKERYFYEMVRYINQNARKHGAIEVDSQYRFSSYRATITSAPSLICREELAKYFANGLDLAENLSAEVDEKMIKMFLLEN